MIPIGTLCMIVRAAYPWNGRTCTVTSKRFEGLLPPAGFVHEVGYGYHARFADGVDRTVDERCLRPIAPPGDPDRVDTPTTIPEEIVA